MSAWIHVGVKPFAAVNFERDRAGDTWSLGKVPGGRVRFLAGRLELSRDNVAFQDFEFLAAGETQVLPDA